MTCKDISISLNPSYFCSERCSFCYLTPTQLSDRNTLDINRLRYLLNDISTHYRIVHIDLYGGEPLLLPSEYILELKSLLSIYVDRVYVNTNLVTIPNWIDDDYFYLSVSYDGIARERSDRVYSNLFKLDKPFSVLSLCSKKFLDVSIDEHVLSLSLLDKLQSIELKPYSSNQSNQDNVSYTAFEDKVIELINACKKYNVYCTNEDLISDSLDGNYNAFSDNHLYITPNGQYAVLEFDDEDNEYFLSLDSIDDYLRWCDKEYSRVMSNVHCSTCNYFGHCLTEHYREVANLESNSCNGYYKLLNFYKV